MSQKNANGTKFDRGGGGDDYETERRETEEGNEEMGPKAVEYVKVLLNEKLLIDSVKHPNAIKLIDEEIKKTQQMGRPPPRDAKYVNVYKDKPIKVMAKVLFPQREHPRFNFVGKLLGPKGHTLKALQEETMCRMSILGRGSMRDQAKEEELRVSLEPKFSHLMDDLHVEISAFGPPAEAHARMAFALAEVRKYLTPDVDDNIRQGQFREMEMYGKPPHEEGPPRRPPYGQQMRPSGPPRPNPGMQRGPPGAPNPRVMQAKAKTMSILDRARAAMEESSYGGGYEEEDYSAPAPPYRGGRGGPGGGGGGGYYDENEGYEQPDYYSPQKRGGGGGGYASAGNQSGWKDEWKPSFKQAGGGGFGGDKPRYRATPYSRPDQ